MKILKRCTGIIKNYRLVQALLDDNNWIFKEVRKLRDKKNLLSSRIDDSEGLEDIAQNFPIFTRNSILLVTI